MGSDLTQRAAGATGEVTEPRIWLLTGYRAGDNAQVMALAEALGWPYEVKHFTYQKYEFLTNRLLGETLAGIDPQQSDTICPPWPDLIITAGRRNEPIARWIKSRSSGRTKIVHLGRNWAAAGHFDLIITTPQYWVPAAPNVLEIEAPLHRVTAARLAEAAALWSGKVAHLRRPLITVAIGGDAPPYVFDARMARHLATLVLALARQQQGSLLLTTSPRTSVAACDTLAEMLRTAPDVPSELNRWQKGAAANPYVGYLALADIIVVTGESMSMIAEACATGKPVQILDMGEGWTRMRAPEDASPGTSPALPLSQRLWPKRLIHWLLAHGLPKRIRRDMRNILRPLVAHGHASWLGDPLPGTPPATSSDLQRSTTRVRALFGQ